MENACIPHPVLYEKWNKNWQEHTLIYLGAHTGWGKTTVVQDWLREQPEQAMYLSLDEPNWYQLLLATKKTAIVLDDLYRLDEGKQQEELYQYILAHIRTKRFFLISRAALPVFLKPLFLTNQLVVYGKEDLRFSPEQIATYIRQQKIELSVEQLAMVVDAVRGYPLGVMMTEQRILRGEEINPIFFQFVQQDVYDCYDRLLFQRWDKAVQMLLLQSAGLPGIRKDLLEMVMGGDQTAVIDRILHLSGFLEPVSMDEYRIQPFFQGFLLWEQERLCSEATIRMIWHNAGLYYELHGQIIEAMECYHKSNDMTKIAQLLIADADRTPSNGHYRTAEPYYKLLPENTIASSPQLMAGMCMVCSLHFHPEQSDYWFAQLENYLRKQSKGSREYQIAQSKLLYLRIALPHRGSYKLIGILKNACQLIQSDHIRLQDFTVTGSVPSLLNGGKDFLSWMKSARKFHRMLKLTLDTALQKSGVGVADIGLGEALYEQGEDLLKPMMLVNSGLNAAIANGTVEVQFAAIGVLVRMYVSQGQLTSAIQLLDNFKNKLDAENARYLEPNAAALMMRLALLSGDSSQITAWMSEKAPDEVRSFFTMDRYCYMTKIRGYLWQEDYWQALALLGKLKVYFERYDRLYCHIEAQLLEAILLFHCGKSEWQECFIRCLERMREYSLVRLVAEEGAAVLPLLQKITISDEDGYLQAILLQTQQQAVLYPRYLKKKSCVTEELTKTERQVLHLIVQGLTNDEIASLLNIGVRTVKYHVTNLYAKLQVKNRTQAIRVATENGWN